MTHRRGATVLAILLAAAAALSLLHVLAARPGPMIRAQSRPLAVLPELPVRPELSAAHLAALPEARYDAVIATLLPAAVSAHADTAYRLREDTVLYAADRTTPVARLAARNFLGEPSVVVPVEHSGDWLRVLTPARQRLPSHPAGTDPASTNSAGALAPAQTSAWLRADSLSSPTILANPIIVSVSAQTLSIRCS